MTVVSLPFPPSLVLDSSPSLVGVTEEACATCGQGLRSSWMEMTGGFDFFVVEDVDAVDERVEVR